MKSPRTIHITVRSPPSNKPRSIATEKPIHYFRKKNFNVSIHKIRKNSERKIHSSCSTKIQPYDHFSSQENKTKSWLNDTDTTKDHHQHLKKSKKKIYLKHIVVISMTITLIIGAILTAILVGLFLKSNRQTKPSSTVIPSLKWNSVGITIAGISNVAGNASNQLNQPKDIALIYPNLLYIADYNNHRIQQYQIGSSTGTTVAGQANGVGGTSMNQLKHPSNILVDSSSGIFISDSDNNRVQYWSNGATAGQTVAGSSAGTLGNTSSTLAGPVGLAYSETSGTLYIADFGNNRVMGYLSNAPSGNLAAGDGTYGIGPTQLWKPAGLYFDIFTNSLVIANHNAHNIVRWILGGTNWTIVAGNPNGTSGNNSVLLKYPQHLTFDPMGNLYVVDGNNHRIQLFVTGQTDAITIAGVASTSGLNSTLLNTPQAVILDNQLNLYVADTNNHRIQKFLRY